MGLNELSTKYMEILKQREKEREIFRNLQIRLRTREGQFRILRHAMGDATITKILTTVNLPNICLGRRLNESNLEERFMDAEDKIRQMQIDYSGTLHKLEELSANKHDLLDEIDKLEENIIDSQKSLLSVQKDNKYYNNMVKSIQKGNQKTDKEIKNDLIQIVEIQLAQKQTLIGKIASMNKKHKEYERIIRSMNKELKTGHDPVQNLLLKNKTLKLDNAALKATSSELRVLLYHQYSKTESKSNSSESFKERDQLLQIIKGLKEQVNLREKYENSERQKLVTYQMRISNLISEKKRIEVQCQELKDNLQSLIEKPINNPDDREKLLERKIYKLTQELMEQKLQNEKLQDELSSFQSSDSSDDCNSENSTKNEIKRLHLTIDNLKERNFDLEKLNKQAELRINSLRADIASLTEQSSKINTDDMQYKLIQIESEKEKLSCEKNLLEEKANQLENEVKFIKELQLELEKEKKLRQTVEDQLSTLKESEKNEENKRNRKDIENELEEVTKDRNMLNDKMLELSDTLQKLRTTQEDMTKRKNCLNDHINLSQGFTDERVRYTKKIETLENKLKSAEKKLTLEEQRSNKAKLTELSLEKEIRILSRQNEKIKQENIVLKESNQSLQAVREDIQHLENKGKDLERSAMDIKNKHKDVHKQYKHLNDEMQKDITDLHNCVYHAALEMKEFMSNGGNFDDKEIKEIVKDLTEEKKTQVQVINKLHDKIKSLDEDIRRYETEIANSNKVNQNLENWNNELKNEVEKISKKLEEELSERDKVEGELDNVKKNLSISIENSHTLENRIALLEQNGQNKDKQLDVLEKELEMIYQELDHFKTKVAENGIELKKKEEINIELIKTLEEIKSENECLKNESLTAYNSKTNLDETLYRSQQELEELTNVNFELKLKLKQNETNELKLIEKLKELETKINSINKKYDAEINKKFEEQQELNSSLLNVQQELQNKISEYDKLYKQLELERQFKCQLENDKRKLDLLIQDLIKEKGLLKSTIEDLKKQNLIEENDNSQTVSTHEITRKLSYLVQVNCQICQTHIDSNDKLTCAICCRELCSECCSQSEISTTNITSRFCDECYSLRRKDADNINQNSSKITCASNKASDHIIYPSRMVDKKLHMEGLSLGRYEEHVVPIYIDKIGTKLIWKFHSNPKDIQLSLEFYRNIKEFDKENITQQVIEPTVYGCSKKIFTGKLNVHKAGFYVFKFNNIINEDIHQIENYLSYELLIDEK
ncbi:DgyrCDS2677 [Dimorphilus gyrociliatus]|nr:DgyrCDS2677 [Dimorphilus gyrociliatus]